MLFRPWCHVQGIEIHCHTQGQGNEGIILHLGNQQNRIIGFNK